MDASKHTLPGPSVKLSWTVLVMMMVSRVIQAVILASEMVHNFDNDDLAWYSFFT